MFPHRNIHKYTRNSPDGKTHNSIDHKLIDKRWQSIILDIRSFREADRNTDHYMGVSKAMEKLAVNKQATQKFGRKYLISGS